VLAPLGNDKDVIRTVHGVQRDDRLAANRQFISDKLPKLLKHFASGADVAPTRISPVLERIDTATWQGDLFRLASLTGQFQFQMASARRLRYLVWDKQNEKLLGIIAIGDPIFNLSVRDNHGREERAPRRACPMRDHSRELPDLDAKKRGS
jgi:hypothetical protein